MSQWPDLITSSLTKDMTGKEDNYRAPAIRALTCIVDASMVQSIERYMKQASSVVFWLRHLSIKQINRGSGQVGYFWFANHNWQILIKVYTCHRLFSIFLSNTNKWIYQILEFRKKSWVWEEKFDFFYGGSWNFCLKIKNKCCIFEFRREICLSLAKVRRLVRLEKIFSLDPLELCQNQIKILHNIGLQVSYQKLPITKLKCTKAKKRLKKFWDTTVAGLEPAIPSAGNWCLIH